MNDKIFEKVKQFLKIYYKKPNPLLLGLSGGSDSIALLYLLLDCRAAFPLEIHIAHIDHGWREESREEAQILQELAKSLKLPFYSYRIPTFDRTLGNLEGKARDERLRFFSELYSKGEFQALVLAHHLDDQAETVIKRIFEGAHLTSLGAMSSVSTLHGMNVWRPLIEVSKKNLISWLKERELKWFTDSTNEDERFLRARMRRRLTPFLTEQFGKNFHFNLLRMSEASFQLKAYMEKKFIPYYEEEKIGPFGTYIDFNRFYPLEKFEIKEFLKEYFRTKEAVISHASLDLLFNFLEAKAADRWIHLQKFSVFIDRGLLFFVQDIPIFSRSCFLETRSFSQGGWGWQVTCKKSKDHQRIKQGWRNCWLGKIEVALPDGEYELIQPSHELKFPRTSSIKYWWTEQKIPAFLRASFPLISKKGKVVYDFLSGSMLLKQESEELLIVSLEVTKELKNRQKLDSATPSEM